MPDNNPERPSILVARQPSATAEKPLAPAPPQPTVDPPRAPVAAPPRSTQEDLALAFGAPVKLPPLSMFYRATLAVLVGCVFLLPVLYALLPAGLAAGGVGWILLLKDRVYGVRSAALLVIPPLGLWAAAYALLVPVFQRKPAAYQPALVLPRSQEPLVYTWVEKTAQAIGAPVPDQIELLGDANACVVFHKNYRVLRLGLPLLAVCNLTQATGVLAHELGHLRQGWARKALLACMEVDGWFRRVLAVTQEDLLEGNPNATGMIMALAMWLSGLVLGVFSRVAQFICWRMSRHMELDADRYEVTIAGTPAFTAVMDVLGPAHLAVEEALERAAHGEAPCPDNLSRYAARQVRVLGSGEKKQLARAMSSDAAGVPHPPYEARLNAARAWGQPGSVKLDHHPASAVFQDFDQWARAVTLRQVQTLLPDGVPVVPLEQMPPRQG